LRYPAHLCLKRRCACRSRRHQTLARVIDINGAPRSASDAASAAARGAIALAASLHTCGAAGRHQNGE